MAGVLYVKRIACMKYITTFVVSKENDRKERNERKKKTKMTTIEKLQQLGAGQYIDFSIEGTDSALECYLCSDRHADAIKSIRILNVEGTGLVLEVELGEIMMFKPTTVYISIEEKEIMDPVEASEIRRNNVEVLYSSNVEDDKEAATEETEVVEITTSWHKATDKIAMTYAQIKYIDALATEGNIEGWDFPSNTNAQRSLTKYDASEIIDALKSGKKVVIK
jgi:hypothetical protein|nr:MAG TPA: Protein of unknown function (DUF3072) [Caudoviricetes sp.]